MRPKTVDTHEPSYRKPRMNGDARRSQPQRRGQSIGHRCQRHPIGCIWKAVSDAALRVAQHLDRPFGQLCIDAVVDQFKPVPAIGHHAEFSQLREMPRYVRLRRHASAYVSSQTQSSAWTSNSIRQRRRVSCDKAANSIIGVIFTWPNISIIRYFDK